MIGGHVNAYREAVISLSVEGSSSLRRDIDAVIDTGFNGYLTLPAALVQALGLVWRRRGS
jgi:predicted aspartyl protease